MTIDCTSQQFENLLKLVYLGHWMANGVRIEEEWIEKFKEVEQLVYAYARESDSADLVEYKESKNEFVPAHTLEADAELERVREHYESEVFWTELTQRLAMRDFMKSFGPDAVSMPLKEQSEKRHVIIERYIKEFEKNDINNLVVSDDVSLQSQDSATRMAAH